MLLILWGPSLPFEDWIGLYTKPWARIVGRILLRFDQANLEVLPDLLRKRYPTPTP